MIELTYRELEKIASENLLPERFEVTYNDLTPSLPGDGTKPSDFMEDDGRLFFVCNFTDKKTKTQYSFQYVHHPEYDHDFPCSLLHLDEEIKIVEKSTIPKPKKKRVFPKVLKREKLSEQSRKNKQITRIYDKTTKSTFDINNTTIPKKDLKKLIAFYKNRMETPFSILDIRLLFLPLCIEHRTEINSLWRYVQSKG